MKCCSYWHLGCLLKCIPLSWFSISPLSLAWWILFWFWFFFSFFSQIRATAKILLVLQRSLIPCNDMIVVVLTVLWRFSVNMGVRKELQFYFHPYMQWKLKIFNQPSLVIMSFQEKKTVWTISRSPMYFKVHIAPSSYTLRRYFWWLWWLFLDIESVHWKCKPISLCTFQ